MTHSPSLPALLIGLAVLAASALPGFAAGLAGQKVTPEMRSQLFAAARACRPDINRLCADVDPGDGRIVLCLIEHKAEVSKDCSAAMQSVPKP